MTTAFLDHNDIAVVNVSQFSLSLASLKISFSRILLILSLTRVKQVLDHDGAEIDVLQEALSFNLGFHGLLHHKLLHVRDPPALVQESHHVSINSQHSSFCPL